MARYIDADRFKEHMKSAMERMHTIGGVKAVDVGAVIKALDMQPTADVAPKSEVAREIFADIEDLLREWFDFFRQADDIWESCAIMAALSQVTERKKKYTEGET